ncbi:MAG: hypothetical protein H0V94_10925, partial [Actinobacteria bacterium]|nr:hypothetical protein [Actinomycetota bacterium]
MSRVTRVRDGAGAEFAEAAVTGTTVLLLDPAQLERVGGDLAAFESARIAAGSTGRTARSGRRPGRPGRR